MGDGDEAKSFKMNLKPTGLYTRPWSSWVYFQVPWAEVSCVLPLILPGAVAVCCSIGLRTALVAPHAIPASVAAVQPWSTAMATELKLACVFLRGRPPQRMGFGLFSRGRTGRSPYFDTFVLLQGD